MIKPINYCLVAVFLLIILYYLHPIPLQGANVDLGHHLLLGKIILSTQSVPTENIFAYTAPHFHYSNTSWLTQVIFHIIFTFFSYNGLIFTAIGVICAVFIFLFKNSELHGKLSAALIIAVINLQILIDRAEVKPELFSLLFLSIYLFILYSYRKKFTKWIFMLPLMQILWVNMHIFFIIGTAVVCFFLTDEILNLRHTHRRKEFFLLTVVTILTFCANILNPQLLKGALYPFMVFSNYGYAVIENHNFFVAVSGYKDITFFYFLTSVLLLWLTLLFTSLNKQTRKVDVLLATFFSFLAFYAVRNFSLFAVGAFVPTVIGFHAFLTSVRKKHSLLFFQKYSVIFLFLLCIFIMPGFIWSFTIHNFGLGIIDDANEAVSLLKKNKIAGPIYNNYNLGNYLEYQFYPQEKVFVNGSPEAYPKAFFENVYYPIERSYDTFLKESTRYGFNVVFYDHVNQTTNTNPLLSGLSKDNAWKLIYLNNRVVVFVKNTNANRGVISSHLLTEQNLRLKVSDTDSKDKLKTLSNLFRIFGWYEKMYEMDLKLLDYDPNNCIALKHVQSYMSSTNHPLAATYTERLQNHCL